MSALRAKPDIQNCNAYGRYSSMLAHWLTKFDTPRAYMWGVLQSDFLADPKAFNAAMISQLRALGSELGLAPSSRAHMGKKIIKTPVESEGGEFFT